MAKKPYHITKESITYKDAGVNIDEGNKLISEISQISEFYPNPAREIINFDYEMSNKAELVILNVLGQEIKTIYLDNKGTKKINVSNLSKGIYFGNVIANNKLVDIKKIIIE